MGEQRVLNRSITCPNDGTNGSAPRIREKRTPSDGPGSRRERSSLSDSRAGDEDVTHELNIRRCKVMSLYGAPPSCRFGPKASLLQSQDSVLTIQDPGSQMLTWYKLPQSVLVVKKIWDDVVDQPFVELATWLAKDRRMDVYVEKKVMEDPLINLQCGFARIRDDLFTFKEDCDNLSGKIDIIICLGGDGTLLYASSLFQDSVPPVLAFHLGSLGFLSPFEFGDFKEIIDSVIGGKSTRLMLRTRLKCFMKHVKEVQSGENSDSASTKPILAINEVVVDRGATPYLCHLDLYIHQRLVTVVQGDGLIISTPTGSTAYAAAAGASMVHPNVPAIIIAPICPHSLSFRPVVVPAGVEVKVMVSEEARGDAWASFDGRQRQLMTKGSSLIISTSKYPLPSVCRHDPINDWFDSLAACLHWNDRKIQAPLSSSSFQSNRRELTPDTLDSSESDSSGSINGSTTK